MVTSNSPSILERERSRLHRLITATVVCAISGGATLALGAGNYFLQLCVLLHVFSGLFVAYLTPIYVLNHVRRTLGIRRPLVLLTGLIATLAALAIVATGLYLSALGLTETNRWVLTLHIGSSVATVLLIAGHILWHLATFTQRKSRAATARFASATGFRPRLLLVSVTGIFALLAVTSAVLRVTQVEHDGEPAVANYAYPYGDHPFRPSQTETYHGAFMPVYALGNASDCGTCHTDIAQQWQASAHRHAADEPTYVRNINLLADKKGIEATRYCEGCHAPVALLSGQLSEGGLHGGIPGTPAHHEGVGCLGCHGIKRLTHTKGVASFEMGPPSAYLFTGRQESVFTAVRHYVMKLAPDMHRAEVTPHELRDARFCVSCHVQFMDKDMNHWGWVKMQDEYSAWLAGPYSGNNADEFGATSPTTCQHCHMEPEPANDPSANQEGLVAGHYFPGANTMIPLMFDDEAHLNRTKDFLRRQRMSITIEPPHRRTAVQTHQALDETLRTHTESPAYWVVGERATLNVTVSNLGVGHNFPGGTLDINEAWVEFAVMDASGEMVYSSGAITGDAYSPLGVDPTAEFYRSRPVDKQGKLVWKHDLFNRIGEAEKRVVPAGKSDILTYSFVVPDWVSPPLTVVSTLKYRKLNDRYARWALEDQYMPLPVVDMARDTLTIPVHIELDTQPGATGSSGL